MSQAQEVLVKPPDTVGFVPQFSYLWYFINRRAIRIQYAGADNHVLPAPAWVNSQGRRRYMVGLDLGNSGPKGAMFDSAGRIVANHLQATIKAVQDLAAGSMGTVYEEMVLRPKTPAADQRAPQPEDEEVSLGKEWIDVEAIHQEGVSLSRGTTRARISDPRYPRFLMYVLADLFRKADYPSGDYELIVAPGMPNEEMSGPHLDAETLKALTGALCHKEWRIRITDQQGTPVQFNLKVADLAPGPQSYAGFYAWQFKPDGQPAQTVIREIALEDLGAVDLHELLLRLTFEAESKTNEERIRVAVTATRERKGDGVILAMMQPFARRLKKAFGLEELDDAVAQEAFLRKEITVGGFREDLTEMVELAQAEEGAKIITDVFKGPRRPRSFYMIEGGGNVLLRAALVDKLTSLNRTPKTYLLLGAEHARYMNAVGLLAILDQISRYGQA